MTNTLRAAFGLDLFGFDVLVKHDQTNSSIDTSVDDILSVRGILVVDVNYFLATKKFKYLIFHSSWLNII